jgi:hypothetical protein
MKVNKYSASHEGNMSASDTGRWMKVDDFEDCVADAPREVVIFRQAIFDAAAALAGEGLDKSALDLLMIVSRVRST